MKKNKITISENSTDSNLQALWDSFVKKSPQATMYHYYGWRNVLEKTFGYKSYYIYHVDNEGQIDSILPLFVMRDVFQRKFLVSNPFSNFAGICAKNEEIKVNMLRLVTDICKEIGANYVEFRQLNNPIDLELPTKNSFVTLFLDIQNKSKEDVWKSLKSRNRGKIRKAEKFGFKVEFGKKGLRGFYNVYARNVSRLGTPIMPYRFFKNIIDIFPEQTEILSLEVNNRIISSMFIFKHQNIIAEPWVSSLSDYNRYYVNNYLYWKAIEYACENKYSIFDFGRSTINTGTYFFKTQWGARPVRLYYQYVLNKSDKIPEVDAKNNKYQKAIDIWKRLPLQITAFWGPKIVKYLPEL